MTETKRLYPVVAVICPWTYSTHAIHRAALIESAVLLPSVVPNDLTDYHLQEFRDTELISRFVLNYRGPEWKENTIGEPTACLGEAGERETRDSEIAAWFAQQIAAQKSALLVADRVNIRIDLSSIKLGMWVQKAILAKAA